MGIVAAVVLVFVLVGGWGVWTFNRLVALRNTQREAWSGIDVQLRKRHNLVPALVECVKGYQAHERMTFESIGEMRSGAATPDLQASENRLTGQLRSLFAVAEAYPELKANESFQQLSAQLVAIENDLQYARRYYNGAVRDLRNAVESFPSNFVAGLFGFSAGEFFEIELATDRATPQVKL